MYICAFATSFVESASIIGGQSTDSIRALSHKLIHIDHFPIPVRRPIVVSIVEMGGCASLVKAIVIFLRRQVLIGFAIVYNLARSLFDGSQVLLFNSSEYVKYLSLDALELGSSRSRF